MKRVLCLYRVSTLKQVDKKDDIPMQRRECKDFIDRMEDWAFYDERMEKGVSGYKGSAKNRDIIVEIREMANASSLMCRLFLCSTDWDEKKTRRLSL